MQTELRIAGVPLTPDLREHIEQSLGQAFSRCTAGIRGVRLSLADINGPKGGEDIRCRVHARGEDGDMIVREQGENPFEAVARACARARQTLARRAARRRSIRRRRQRRMLQR